MYMYVCVGGYRVMHFAPRLFSFLHACFWMGICAAFYTFLLAIAAVVFRKIRRDQAQLMVVLTALAVTIVPMIPSSHVRYVLYIICMQET